MSSTRRLATVSALAALLTITATVTSHAGGPWPHSVGGGTAADGTKFAFSALVGPSSTRGDYGSHGHARLDFLNGAKVQGPVLCASVNETTFESAFVFQYTDAAGNSQQLRVYVKDGGDGPGVDSIGWDVIGATCSVNPDNTVYPANSGMPANTQGVVKGSIDVSGE